MNLWGCRRLKHQRDATPKSRFYQSFEGDEFEQNFTGILFGDLNGSFDAPLGKIAGSDGEREIVNFTDPSFHVGVATTSLSPSLQPG